ncbi:MAG: AAA family ATPase, partial [Lactococcus lactis]|nr:AAA family ATPase [Lactococcus lactis]
LVDFKNTVLIMTSNVGSQYLLDNVGENGEISEETTENVMSQLRAHFKPEFLNRIDDTILFKPLALEDIKNIILKMTSQLAHRLEEMEVELELSEEVKVWIAENAYEPAYGARPLKRYLTKVIENPLAKLIIGGKIPPKSKVIVRLIDNKVDFDIQSIAE